MLFAKNKTFRSLRFRLTGLFVLIFGTTLILFSVILFGAFKRSHQSEFDAALFNHAVDISRNLEIDMFGEVSISGDALLNTGKLFPFHLDKTLLQVLNPEGRIMARSRGLGHARLPLFRNDIDFALQHGAALRTIDSNVLRDAPAFVKSSYRVLTYMVHDTRVSPNTFILQIAAPMSLFEREVRNLALLFFFSIPVTFVVATLGGLYLSKRALAPVNAIIDKTKKLDSANLSERIPIPEVDDELRQLTLTLNELLDRLQLAFESQEKFVANASHELKTPLAIIRSELDLMASRPRSAEQTALMVTSMSQEIDHLSKLVENLLLLARIDAGVSSLSIQKVRLDELVIDVVSRLERTAHEKNISLRLNLVDGTEFETRGDPGLLQSMLQNLIENAIKFSPPSTSIEISLASRPQTLFFSVSDQGPGIPPQMRTKIFDRFYQLDQSKSRTPGFGLGLSIANQIARAHNATLLADQNAEGGSIFSFEIKKI
jgi:signal transduction histidine kinase